MTLLNFDLESPYASIAIKGLGYTWDLHNCADFAGFAVNANDNSLSMTWDASSDTGSTWDGRPENESCGCRLIFRNVMFIHVTPRDEAYPRDSDWRLSGISKKIPGATEYPFKDVWADGEPFNLLFEFESERSLEIGAESAELVPTL